MKVAFFGVDGSRADLDFLADVYRAALDAGAAEVVVVDTLGIAAPEAVTLFVGRIRDAIGRDVPLHYHGHDDFGLATAGAIAAVRAGADWIHATVNGMGERAGNANLPEIALALEALYGYRTNLRLEETVRVSSRVREICGYELAPWSPLVGENLFRRETGAVAAQFHDPPAVEPYSSTARRRNAGDRPRQEERCRFDPHQGGRARSRASRGAAARRARGRQSTRDREGRARRATTSSAS